MSHRSRSSPAIAGRTGSSLVSPSTSPPSPSSPSPWRKRGAPTSDLQRLQERDERALLLGVEPEAEAVARHRPPFHPAAAEAGRHVVVAQAARIEPVLEG